MSKLIASAVAGLIAVTAMSTAPTIAAADWKGPPKYGYGQGYNQGYRQGYRNNRNSGWGPGFATGAVVGLGLGVLATTPRYVAPPPRVYYAPPPPPVYYAPPPPRAYYRWTQAHVDWCYANYRSYNAANNTFVGYDGYLHQCVGPY
ncbi:MAG: BA14K family protein [Rhodospirillaceae bacterium]|nr:BA14K family protein [Rhodospirillaceae bacterium]